jgi:hypothetical protein
MIHARKGLLAARKNLTENGKFISQPGLSVIPAKVYIGGKLTLAGDWL